MVKGLNKFSLEFSEIKKYEGFQWATFNIQAVLDNAKLYFEFTEALEKFITEFNKKNKK